MRGMHFNIKAFWSSFSTWNSVSQSKHPRGDGSAYNQEAQLNPPILSQLFLFRLDTLEWIPQDTITKLTRWILCSCLVRLHNHLCFADVLHYNRIGTFLSVRHLSKAFGFPFALCWFLSASIFMSFPFENSMMSVCVPNFPGCLYMHRPFLNLDDFLLKMNNLFRMGVLHTH